jgi:hypothetical protein
MGYSPSWYVIARAQPEAISNARLETASPLARSDMRHKVNSYLMSFMLRIIPALPVYVWLFWTFFELWATV